MKRNDLSLFLLLIIFTISCQIKGSFKGLYSYKKEINGMKALIHNDQFSCEIKYTPQSKLAIANGLQIKDCLEQEEKTMTYLWKPNRRSEKCIDLNLLQSFCDDNDLSLYVIAEYYDRIKMNLEYDIMKPTIGIDTDYYNSNRTPNYLKSFLRDVGIKEDSVLNSSFYIFDKGVLSSYSNNLDVLDTSRSEDKH